MDKVSLRRDKPEIREVTFRPLLGTKHVCDLMWSASPQILFAHGNRIFPTLFRAIVRTRMKNVISFCKL